MIIDGRAIAQTIQMRIQERIKSLVGRPPCLAVILVGNHPASRIYVTRKTQACQSVGIQSYLIEYPSQIEEQELLNAINNLNENEDVDGILVQLPLPEHISPSRIVHAVSPQKDVDGFHPMNIGKLLLGEIDGFTPCTPLGIQTMLTLSGVSIPGKHVVIIGRSAIVGKPLAALLMQNTPQGNATVTVAHSQTRNLAEISRMADILVVATGLPEWITADLIKEEAVVVDVGINQIMDKASKSGFRLVGDVNFSDVVSKCSLITPVPGGVGPMTIAMLLQNTLLSYSKRFSLS